MACDWEKEKPVPVIDRGPWIATARGGMWSLTDPHPLDVHIGDIAAGLSRNCRYAGQIRHDVEFYSVAEHSVLILEWLVEQGVIEYREDGLKAILHDGSEGYLVDMATPLKALLPGFRKIEDKCQTAVDTAFGIDSARIGKSLIKTADIRIRIDEREALINEPALSEQKRIVWEHTPEMEGLGVKIQGLMPRAACQQFLESFIFICEALPLRDPGNEAAIARQHEEAVILLDRLENPAILKPFRPMSEVIWMSGPAEEILGGAFSAGPFHDRRVAEAWVEQGEILIGKAATLKADIVMALQRTPEGFEELPLEGLDEVLRDIAERSNRPAEEAPQGDAPEL